MSHFLSIILLMLAVSAHAEIHMWTDEKGKKHFSDKPPVNVETSIVEVKVNTYESPNIESIKDYSGTNNKVVMYSAVWCGVCKKAKQYFDSNNVNYSEYDIDTSSKGKRDFKRMGGKGVPIILVGEKRLNGFSQATFETIYND